MLTKNNWFDCNLGERVNDPNLNFDVSIKPYPCDTIEFGNCSELVAKEIFKEYNNLYLGFSGGLDSEYVLRTFHKLGIPIKPIIVYCGNKEETKYAFDVCSELNIEPIILKVFEESLFQYFKKNIMEKINGIGFNITHTFFAAEYAKNNNGYLVTGIHLVGDDGNQISFASTNEYDFYVDSLIGNVIHFFMYDIMLVKSMFALVREGISWNDYKHEIYNLTFRDKLTPKYTDYTNKKISQLMSERMYKPKTGILWPKKEIMEMINV